MLAVMVWPSTSKTSKFSSISTFLTLTMMQKAVLKQCLIELYNQFRITWTTEIKILRNTDFPIFSDPYELTKNKEILLGDASKKRGHALFMIGFKRLHIRFDIPEYKFAYMGKTGGR